MNDHVLSVSETHALFALVLLAREATNRDVQDTFGFPIEKHVRESLLEKGLITCHLDVKPFRHEATDAGWNRVRREFIGSAPPRADRGVRIMYRLLNQITSYMEKHDIEMIDLFGNDDTFAGSLEIEAAVRAAYGEIAPAPGAWIRLSHLREALSGVPKESLDDALVHLHQLRQIQLAPESNQKGLTKNHLKAALRIGGEEHHLIAVGEAG